MSNLRDSDKTLRPGSADGDKTLRPALKAEKTLRPGEEEKTLRPEDDSKKTLRPGVANIDKTLHPGVMEDKTLRPVSSDDADGSLRRKTALLCAYHRVASFFTHPTHGSSMRSARKETRFPTGFISPELQ